MFLAAALAALFGALAWLYSDCLWRLPHPYEAIPIQPIDDEWAYLFAQASNFTSMNPIMAHVVNKTPGHFTPLRGARLQRLFQGQVKGSESVAVSPSGRLTMLDRAGYVHHATPTLEGGYELDTRAPPLYIGPGRPLGFHYAREGVLLVCDSLRGLLEVDLQRPSIRVLTNAAEDGTPINYANDLALSADGEWVYFTSSGRGTVALNPLGFYDTMRSFLLTMYSADITGRLLRYHLPSGRTETLATGLWFPNGVALSPQEDYVLVVETVGLRIFRRWLSGPYEGTMDVFLDRLPGHPDGLSRSSDGNFWVCLTAPLSPVLPYLHLPLVRRLLALLSVQLGALQYIVNDWGCVLKVSPAGEVLEVLLDPTGEAVFTVSAVTESEGKLFLGNLKGDFVSVFQL